MFNLAQRYGINSEIKNEIMKERLIEFLAYLDIGQLKFENNVGLSRGYVNKLGDGMTAKIIAKIEQTYPQLNIEWLLYGKGDMLKEQSDTTLNYTMVPVLNLDVAAGIDRGNNEVDIVPYIERYVPFVDARKGDVGYWVYGNSMIPTYSAGSIVITREIEHWQEYFGYGNNYVLVLKDGRRIIKQIQKADDHKANVLCVSANEMYPPEELPRSMIFKVFKVIGHIASEGY